MLQKTRRGRSLASWLRVIVATALAAAIPSAAGGQVRRQLQSRAAFAALDSVALADSSAMIALDVHERLDSLMLDMFAVLDDSAAVTFGMSPSRIRRWDGFGSQAHPAFGILVDGDEVKILLTKVRALKGMVSVPPDEITRRAEWAVRFLVSHEFAHLVQYHVFGAAWTEDPTTTRIVECAADLLGGYQYQAYLSARAVTDSIPSAARAAAEDFGYVIGGNDWLDGTTHPLAESRRACIATGMSAAAGMGTLARARAGAADSVTDPTIRWLAEHERELRDGRVTPVEWSRTRAQALAAEGAVAVGNRELEVIRDTSLSRILVILVSRAEQGSAELRKSRGGLAPGGRNVYLLREALPMPWQCTAEATSGVEEASCSFVARTSRDSADAMVAALISQARTILENRGWLEVSPDSTDAAVPDRRRIFRRVDFAARGANPASSAVARVELFLGDALQSPTEQLPPGFIVGLAVRAMGKK